MKEKAKMELPVRIELVLFALVNSKLKVGVLPVAGDKFHLPLVEIIPQKDNNLKSAAQRQIKNLKLTCRYLEQTQTLGEKKVQGKGWTISIVYFGLLAPFEEEKETCLQWLTLEQALQQKWEANEVLAIKESWQRLKSKSLYTSLPLFLLPFEFTLTELQKIYENILGFKIEKKSFRRRLLDADLLRETGKERRASHRPAQLYQVFASDLYFFSRIIEGAREKAKALNH